MTKERFFYLVEGLNWELRARVETDLARLESSGYIVDYVSWDAYFNMLVASERNFHEASIIFESKRQAELRFQKTWLRADTLANMQAEATMESVFGI